MGGNAIKTSRRHSAAEYHEKVKLLLLQLTNLFTQTGSKYESYFVAPAVQNKESFGDVDIIYTTTSDSPFSIGDIIKDFFSTGEDFSPEKIFHNGEVISFDFKSLQVDLIHVKKSYREYAECYFSH